MVDFPLPLFDRNPDYLDALKTRYNEPHRHYHSWAHIEQLLALFDTVKNQIAHRQSVLYAIYYHDAVYNVPGADNEEASAKLFLNEAKGVVEESEAELAAALIVATKTHKIDESLRKTAQHDCALFLDIDMSILGADEAAYQQYAHDVRKEYAVFPDEMYNAGRLKILQEFITRDRLFYSDHFHEILDAAARANIANEIKELQS